jgi:hypothetical protein
MAGGFRKLSLKIYERNRSNHHRRLGLFTDLRAVTENFKSFG